mgnify:CR=1 FL=1
MRTEGLEMSWYHNAVAFFMWAAGWIVATLFSFLVLLTGIQIFNRYVLNFSFAWVEELSKIILLYIVFLSGSIAIYRNAFSAFETYKVLPATIQFFTLIVINLAILAFQVVVLFMGLRMVTLTMTQITPALQIPQSISYGAIPLGMAFMIIVTVDRLLTVVWNDRGE